jgi:hypothetical protein
MIAPGDADAGRDSSGIRDAGRLIYTLTPMSEDEAKRFDIEPDERHSYVRLDSAKVNIARPSEGATWFHLVGEPIGNGTEDYPSGDEIQVAKPWQPPETWADLDNALLNKILDAIDFGLKDDKGRPTGERYTDASAAKDRAAWRIVQLFALDKTEGQCRAIIRQWVSNGVLVPEPYDSDKDRKPRSGLRWMPPSGRERRKPTREEAWDWLRHWPNFNGASKAQRGLRH